jgi:hypothetical protein
MRADRLIMWWLMPGIIRERRIFSIVATALMPDLTNRDISQEHA